MKRVAVIGAGLIGTVLTGHLARAGHDVHGWNSGRRCVVTSTLLLKLFH